MPDYNFYYDESQHSRSLNLETIKADEFYDGFVVAIVGWDSQRESDLAAQYCEFEKKYLSPNAKELKSTGLKKSHFKYGFKSLSQHNARLISDYLDLFDKEMYVYCSFSSKVELLVDRLLSQYQNQSCFNADLMKCSLAKLLVQYRPLEVVEAIYQSPNDFLDALRDFLLNRIEDDKANPELKRTEMDQCRSILEVMDHVMPLDDYQWEYYSPLAGFGLYLSEHNEIDNCTLIIDQEENTRAAAERLGFDGVREADSSECFGVRMADMLAGLVAKLMKAIRDELTYRSREDEIKKNLFDAEWFNLNDDRLELYKKLYRVLIQYDKCWYKVYGSGFSDDLVVLIALLKYFNNFDSATQLRELSANNAERFNTSCCQSLSEHFQVLSDDPLYTGDLSDPKILFRPRLRITDQPRTYRVLDVMFGEDGAPMALISENGHENAYVLPADLSGWVSMVLSNVDFKDILFPGKVRFQYFEGRFRAVFL